jgi:hypothetical protein
MIIINTRISNASKVRLPIDPVDLMLAVSDSGMRELPEMNRIKRNLPKSGYFYSPAVKLWTIECFSRSMSDPPICKIPQSSLASPPNIKVVETPQLLHTKNARLSTQVLVNRLRAIFGSPVGSLHVLKSPEIPGATFATSKHPIVALTSMPNLA